MTRPSSRECGFSLIEMAIVLLVMGLLLGGGLAMLGAQIEQQRIRDTQRLLEEAREALLGYAASNVDATNHPHLPCPDTANDGVEDRTATPGPCAANEGNLPWVTLGLSEGTDSWGNRLRYAVTPAFANSANGMLLTSTGTLGVNNATGTALATALPAAILSHGKNGFGARNMAGGANAAPTGVNELENTDGDATFISNPPVGVGGTGGEFDDIVVWLAPNILFNRMVQAGRLP